MSARAVLNWGIVIVLAGLIARLPYVVMSGAYLSFVALLAVAYLKGALGNLAYYRELSAGKAFVGDKIRLKVCVENRKPLPVLGLQCIDDVPGDRAIGSLSLIPHHSPGRAFLSNEMHLKWFEKVEREFEVDCLRRGKYRLGPVSLKAGDLLGLETRTVVLPETDTLTVFPRIIRLEGIPWLTRYPLGNLPGAGWLHPDPLSVVGARAYDGRTPASQIAWKATARTGTLQMKVLEPTRRARMVLALNLSTSEHLWEGVKTSALEEAVTVAASACFAMFGQGIPFGLASNGMGSLFIGPGLSASHLERILEIFAEVALPWRPFSETLRGLERRVNDYTGVLAVMPYASEADWKRLVALSRVGPVAVLLLDTAARTEGACGEACLHALSRIPVYVPCTFASEDAASGEVIRFERLRRDYPRTDF